MSREGKILEANLTAGELFGTPREQLVGQAISSYIHADDVSTHEQHRKTLVETGSSASCEVRINRTDGSRRWVRFEGSVDLRTTGSTVFRCVAVDITAARETESTLGDALQELSVIYQHAPIAMMLVDQDRRVNTINEKAARFSGLSSPELIGKTTGEVLRCLAALDDPHGCGFGALCQQCVIRKAVLDTFADRAHRTEIEARVPLSKDAGERYLLISTAYIEYGTAEPRVLVSSQDITARKRAVDQLEHHVQEKEALLREIHHRVKNNLAVISSLLRIQASAIRTPEEAVQAFSHTLDRISAMALVHEDLYASGDFSRIDMRSYLRDLARQVQFAYSMSERVALQVSVDEVFLGIDIAVPCGIILNELITNAFKHAFPAERSGSITVKLDRDSVGGHTLSVCDDGIGLSDNPHREGALGLMLVGTLAKQIGGTLQSCSLESCPDCGTCYCTRF